jgi:hypothetical protein
LSRDWWLSGSAWHVKTADDVWAVLGVKDALEAERAAAVKEYYKKHPDRLAFVPENLRRSLGLA